MAVFEYGIDNKPATVPVTPSGINPIYTAPNYADAALAQHSYEQTMHDLGESVTQHPVSQDRFLQMEQDKSNFNNAVTLSELQAQLNQEAADHSLDNYYDSLKNTPSMKVQGMLKAGVNPLIATGAMAGGNPNPAPVGGASPQSFNSTPTTHKDKFDKAGTLMLGVAAIVGAVAKLL